MELGYISVLFHPWRGGECQSPGPLQCFFSHCTPWSGLGETSGWMGLVRGHCLWVLNNPFPSPPTHNLNSISTPSSGPSPWQQFSQLHFLFPANLFFLPSPSPLVQSLFSPLLVCIPTFSLLSFLSLSLFFALHLSLPAFVQVSLSTASLLSLLFQVHNKWRPLGDRI